MNPKYEKKDPPKPPSASDVWQAATNEKCARSMALWLKSTINTQRPINTLKLEELAAMAQNCVGTFIVEASRRPKDTMTKKEYDELVALLSC